MCMQTTANGIKRQARSAGAWLAGVALAGGGIVLFARVGLGVAADAASGAPVPPATALVGALAAVGVAGLGWLLLGVVLETLSLVPGALGRAAGSVSAALSPRLARRAVAVVVGLGVGAGVGCGGAHAAPQRVLAALHPGVAEALPDPSWRAAPDPGWTPEPPRVRPQPDVGVLAGRPTGADEAGVVVRRGDSLWAIAARHLGEGATDAEVAAQWPRWYEANRDVVGPDPDLIRPGQVLRPPTAADGAP